VEETLESGPLGIAGCRVLRLEAHEDARGSFTEIFRRSWAPGAREMVQANLSRSAPGVLRGLHFHLRQADYWHVVSGTAFVGLVDLRAGSPTFRRSAGFRVEGDRERVGLYLPPGVAHGFYAETEVVLLYLVDAYFTGEDEHGVAWDSAGIAWPVGPEGAPVLSERDRSNPPLEEALEAFGGGLDVGGDG